MSAKLYHYGEVNYRLFHYKGTIYKFKIEFCDNDTSRSCSASVTTDSEANQINRTIGIIMHRIHRRMPLTKAIRTSNFLIDCSESPWPIVKKIEFQLRGRVLASHNHMFILSVKLRQQKPQSGTRLAEGKKTSSLGSEEELLRRGQGLPQKQKSSSLRREQEVPQKRKGSPLRREQNVQQEQIDSALRREQEVSQKRKGPPLRREQKVPQERIGSPALENSSLEQLIHSSQKPEPLVKKLRRCHHGLHNPCRKSLRLNPARPVCSSQQHSKQTSFLEVVEKAKSLLNQAEVSDDENGAIAKRLRSAPAKSQTFNTYVYRRLRHLDRDFVSKEYDEEESRLKKLAMPTTSIADKTTQL